VVAASDHSANGASPKPVVEVEKLKEEPEMAAYSAPAVPSPQSVRHAMNRISRHVTRCRMGQTGQMVMRMSFSGSNGRLVSAEIVNDDFRGTPSGACALRAVQHLRLPSFQQNQLIIVYPFYL
jgi:hypothetical protein